MKKELPEHVVWLVDGDESRYVHQYEFKPFQLGTVGTFYDFNEDGFFDYDTATTCRIESDTVYGEIARKV